MNDTTAYNLVKVLKEIESDLQYMTGALDRIEIQLKKMVKDEQENE